MRLDGEPGLLENEPDAGLGERERGIRALQAEEAELRWVGGILGNFDALWDLLAPENRRRLIRILVRGVVVAEQDGVIRVTLTDLAS